MLCNRPLLVLAILLLEIFAGWGRAEEPDKEDSKGETWPQKVVVTIGDLRTRIDGPKMWTLSGIDFQDTVMATEDSAYGSVLTIRNVGQSGVGFFNATERDWEEHALRRATEIQASKAEQ